MYPDVTAYVDRGNFMHMCYFLRLLCHLVGVGYRRPSGTVGVCPAVLPCLGRMVVSEAPLPGGGSISYVASLEEGRVVLTDVTVSGDASMVDVQGVIRS